MTTLTIAALQLPLGSPDEGVNIAAVSALVEQAAAQGAQVVLPPELFSGPYFCQVEDEALFALARPTAEHPSVESRWAGGVAGCRRARPEVIRPLLPVPGQIAFEGLGGRLRGTRT